VIGVFDLGGRIAASYRRVAVHRVRRAVPVRDFGVKLCDVEAFP
jgi:hypothetical protein